MNMNGEARANLKQLLDGQRVLSLAVLVDGEPHISLLPFAILQDHSAVLVHVSTLALHTKGLTREKSVAVLIHQSEEAVGDPLQVPRVSLKAAIRELRREGPDYHAGRSHYLARFPEAAVTFGLDDFRLFELRFMEGRYVEGFARASDVSVQDLRVIKPPHQEQKDTEHADAGRLWRIPRD